MKTIELTKNQFRLLTQLNAGVQAAAGELRASQFAMQKAHAAHETAMMSLVSLMSCLSLDNGGDECAIGSNFQITEKDGAYTLAITPPLKEASQTAG